jgi:predicted  nucleic acid-binding Zn-ribbon protein
MEYLTILGLLIGIINSVMLVKNYVTQKCKIHKLYKHIEKLGDRITSNENYIDNIDSIFPTIKKRLNIVEGKLTKNVFTSSERVSEELKDVNIYINQLEKKISFQNSVLERDKLRNID